MIILGEAASQTVVFLPARPNDGAFFFRTYQLGSCWNQYCDRALCRPRRRFTLVGLRTGLKRKKRTVTGISSSSFTSTSA